MRTTKRVTGVTLLLLLLCGGVTSVSWSNSMPAATHKKIRKKPAEERAVAEKSREAELQEALDKQARTIDSLTRAVDQMRTQMQQQTNDIQNLKSNLEQSQAQAQEANRKATELAGLPDQVKTLESSTDSMTKSIAEVKKSTDDSKKITEGLAKGLDGFRFSGDFRLRFDGIFRSSDPALGQTHQQNARGRYRFRFNADNTMNKYMDFHVQLVTGPLNNTLTNDQDFTAITGRSPIAISEAWADVHNADRSLSIRGGRIPEVFGDNSKFVFDDDVRFNGFNEIIAHKFSNGGFINGVELRAGQYIFASPNVAIVTSGSPLALAGAVIGSTGRGSQMFHEGVVLKGSINDHWKHEFVVDDQHFRNPNEIQLASVSAGQAILVNGPFGITLSGPFTNGLGNATTTAGGAIYTVPNFNVVRLGYKLNWAGSGRFPVEWNAQVSRNISADFLRDAFLTYISIGQSKNAGDWRFMYLWTIKDANAFVSQLTDDDIGTGTGVNLAVHEFRLDYTLNKHLAWQNIFYVQNERRASNPSQQFFVILPRGTPTQYRIQSQLQFSF